MKRLFHWLIFLIVFSGIGLIGFLIGDYVYFQDRLPAYYFIESFPVGSLREEDALRTLEKQPIQKLVSRPYRLSYGKKEYPFWPWDIGARPLYAKTVRKAFADAQSIFYGEHVWRRLTRSRRVISLNWEITGQGIKDYLDVFQEKVNSRVISAKFYVDRKKGTQIRSEEPGRVLDVVKTTQAVYEGLQRGEAAIPLRVTLTPPKVTTQDLKRIPHPARLSIFTTYYGTHDSPNRIHNISLIASWVDNTVLAPGETFSLLTRTGNFTPEEGYREAFVIVKDMLVPQYGGGACQIATTLYNAVQLADLAVLSRSNHGIYFSIYPLGRDATIYPPSPDFRFRNDTGHPVVVYATATRKNLTFQIFGEKQHRTVAFTPPAVSHHMRKVKEKKKVGEKEVVLETGETTQEAVYQVVEKRIPTTAFSAVVERIVKEEGKEIKREKIYSSYIAHGDRDRIKKARPEPR